MLSHGSTCTRSRNSIATLDRAAECPFWAKPYSNSACNAAHITLTSITGPQTYSVFFSLEKDRKVQTPALRMFVKSAYLKPLVAKANAQSWRFVSLAGQISGAFPPKEKKPKPAKQKKKAP